MKLYIPVENAIFHLMYIKLGTHHSFSLQNTRLINKDISVSVNKGAPSIILLSETDTFLVKPSFLFLIQIVKYKGHGLCSAYESQEHW